MPNSATNGAANERIDVRLARNRAGNAPDLPSGPCGRTETSHVSVEVDPAAALQEDALGRRELLPDAHEVLTLEREIEITREAVRQAVVGRFVAFEPSRGARIIERDGKPQEGQRRQRRWPALRRRGGRRSRQRADTASGISAGPAGQEAEVLPHDPVAASSRATRSRAAACRAAPSSARRRSMSYVGAGDAGIDAKPRPRSLDRSRAARCSAASAAASRRGTISASSPSVSTSFRPSASVATIGFPIASASSTVSGVPSHSDGKTARSNAASASATSRAESAEDQAIAEPQPARPRLELGLQLTLADDVEAGVRASDRARAAPPRRDTRCLSTASAVSRCRPRRRPAAMPSARRAAAMSSALRGRLNSSSGTPR